MKTTQSMVPTVRSHPRVIGPDRRGRAVLHWAAVLVLGLGVPGCTSTALQTPDADVAYLGSASDALGDALARRCAIQVGSAHPRGVVVQSAFERCIERRESLRIGAMLRALEKGR